jgi:glycosyltransferase involved in cell wall biosynthesis
LPHRIIGVICTSSGWGGLELNTMRLVRWLREAGWKVHLLTAGGTPLYLHAGDAPSSLHMFSETGLPRKGAQLRILHAWVRQYKIHVLFVPYNKDISVASLYKRFYDGDIGLVYQQHMQVGVRKRDLIHTLRYAMIDVWISPLRYLKEETLRLTRVPEEKVEVIPFGIEPEQFLETGWSRESARQALSLPAGAFIIGVLGRLDPKKGQDLVIRALASLVRDPDTSYHVVLMGNNTINEGDAFSRSLQQLVQESGLGDRVHFRPYSDDVMVFFRAIDVFAMPSHGETFGMVTVEAMAAGVPVIGTDKDGTREILGEGKYGYLFAKDDVAGFCRQLEALRNDTAIAEKLRLAREEALTRYSKEEMVAGINSVLIELVDEGQ